MSTAPPIDEPDEHKRVVLKEAHGGDLQLVRYVSDDGGHLFLRYPATVYDSEEMERHGDLGLPGEYEPDVRVGMLSLDSFRIDRMYEIDVGGSTGTHLDYSRPQARMCASVEVFAPLTSVLATLAPVISE